MTKLDRYDWLVIVIALVAGCVAAVIVSTFIVLALT